MQNKPTFQTARWNAPHNIKTLITTRLGGSSEGNYSSFNLGTHVLDNVERVMQNRQILTTYLPNRPFWLNQTHGDKVLKIDNSLSTDVIYDCDATLTTAQKCVCLVMTADCLPVLMTDINGSFVAAIHAGWRGVKSNIITKAIELSKVKAKEIIIYIGPAICANHFEVGIEVFDIFRHMDIDNQDFFVKKNNHKFNCNLASIAKLQLVKFGVELDSISLSNECTYCNPDLFYSYRSKNQTGRFASCIWKE